MVGIHGALAMVSKRPEWSLDTEQKLFDGKNEAEFLAQSTADVARHYGGLMDQKSMDWANLIQCLAMVYGSRMYAIAMTPKVKPVRQAQPHEFRAGPQPQFHTEAPNPTAFDKMPNAFEAPAAPEGLATGEIAGIGSVEFPDGHPLKPKLN